MPRNNPWGVSLMGYSLSLPSELKEYKDQDLSMVAAESLGIFFDAMLELFLRSKKFQKINGKEKEELFDGIPFKTAEVLFRELLYIRANLEPEHITGDIYRRVRLSRYGRILTGESDEAQTYQK